MNNKTTSKVTRSNVHLKRVRKFIKDCQDKLQEFYCDDELEKVWHTDNESYREFCYYKHQLENKLADLHDQEHRLLYDIKTIQS